MQQTVLPQPLSGTAAAIPSKSWAHRHLIAAALAPESHETLIRFEASSKDIEATCRVLEALGAKIERLPGTGARVRGICRERLAALRSAEDAPVLDCGESGTTLRHMVPIAAALGCPAGVIFTGSGRLPRRPLEPLAGELRRHGIDLETLENAEPECLLPMRVSGKLQPCASRLSGAVSSQFIGGLLLALSLLKGTNTLTVLERFESEPYVRMTLSVLRSSGITIDEAQDPVSGLPVWTIQGKGALMPPAEAAVEGDWSNAAFWLTAGALSDPQKGGITLTGLNPDSLQGDRAVLGILKGFGARVSVSADAVTVRPSAEGLTAQTIDARQIPDLVPILAVAAGAARGTTRFTHAERLRIKESDRLKTTSALLRLLGVPHEEFPDGLAVHGLGSARAFAGGTIESFQDHRIVMAAAVAAASGGSPVTVTGAEDAAKSYPRFFEDFVRLGGRLA